MRINHNIAALNASNRLKANDNAISKNLQKLSSGYRINSAADDAAGLAVSEKMRAQINGLSQAEDNAQNGISLVQTAEGGLSETESILQRMNTLAVESANGTYQNDTDRANLNKELTALKSEVDRISTSTNFNGISLLDGSLSTPTVYVSTAVGGGAITSTAATAGQYQIKALTTVTDAYSDALTITYTDAEGKTQTVSASVVTATGGFSIAGGDGTTYATDTDAMIAALSADATFSSLFSISLDGSSKLTFTAKTAGTGKGAITSVAEDMNGDKSQALTTVSAGTDGTTTLAATNLKLYGDSAVSTADAVFTVDGQKFAFADTAAHAKDFSADVNVVIVTNSTIDDDAATNMASLIEQKTGLDTSSDTTNISFSSKGQSVAFQIGSDNKDNQRVSLSVANMSSKGLGIDQISIATQTDAEKAIDTIKAAINTVSATRSDLGALQNRLEHTSNNLSTMNENLTSAESTIRDVDMSSEMVDLTKNQILEQAATSMLAQANAQPQNVLSLLKG